MVAQPPVVVRNQLARVVHVGAVHDGPIQQAEWRVIRNIAMQQQPLLVCVTLEVLVPLVGRGPQCLRSVAERSGR